MCEGEGEGTCVCQTGGLRRGEHEKERMCVCVLKLCETEKNEAQRSVCANALHVSNVA